MALGEARWHRGTSACLCADGTNPEGRLGESDDVGERGGSLKEKIFERVRGEGVPS